MLGNPTVRGFFSFANLDKLCPASADAENPPLTARLVERLLILHDRYPLHLMSYSNMVLGFCQHDILDV